MPGLSFISDFKSDVTQNEFMVLKALDSMIHYDYYKRNIILKEKSYILGSNVYDEYPIASFENETFFICLEGRIYNVEDSLLGEELNNLSNLVFQPLDISKGKITDWLLNADGDFIIFVLNKKSNEIIIINDALGHLPLYYHNTNGKLLVSREIKFITCLTDEIKFDRMAIAQYLLFGFSLGKRTLLENVFRLEPSTLIKINLSSLRFEISNIHKFNFEIKKYSKRKSEDNVNELITIFDEACKNRSLLKGGYKNVLFLSGGLDSRTVGASLKKNNIPFCGVTYLKADQDPKIDAITAKQIANIFNIDWSLLKIKPPKGKDILKLLKIKNGLNPLSMSFILKFFDEIRKVFGHKFVSFMGHTGFAIKGIKPLKKIKDLNALINHAIYDNGIFSLNEVTDLLKIRKGDIIDELKKHFVDYPENSLNQKYVHFLIYEYAINWENEGMDRDRFFFWVVTPLWSVKFVNYSMNCPDQQKENYKLYRQFLVKLSPQISAIEYSNYNAPITSKILKIKLFVNSKLPIKIREVIKRITNKNSITYEDSSSIMNCFKEQIRNCKFIDKHLSHPEIASIIKKCSKRQLETLFTITSSIEKLEDSKSTLDRFLDEEFK